MDYSIAYAVWRNPKGDTGIEIVGVPVKSTRLKVTLAARHPAFPGVRLDPSMVDYDPRSAMRRFVERRSALLSRLKSQLDSTEADLLAVAGLMGAGSCSVQVLENDQWVTRSSS